MEHTSEIQDGIHPACGLDGVDIDMIPGEIDFVTVHGLHGDRNDTWETREPQERNMIKEIAGDRDRVMNYGYDPLQPGSGVFFKGGIAKEATALLQQLTEARRSLEPDTFRSIIFIAHDIGASIVKQALYQAGLSPNYNDILSCTKLLVFFGCPQRSLHQKDMEDRIMRLVLLGDRMPFENMLHRVRSLTSDVIESNWMSIESKITLRAKSVAVFSCHEHAAYRIFDKFTATTDLRFEKKIGTHETHLRLPLALARTASITCSVLRSLISEVKEKFSSNYSPHPEDPIDLANKHAIQDFLVSLSPPTRPWATPSSSYEKLQWINEHQKFVKWRESTQSDILIIKGATATSGRISEHMYRAVSDNADRFTFKSYFKFDKNDDRFNNMRSFLASTVTSWVQSNGLDDWVMITEFHRFAEQRSLTNWDLLSVLIKMRTFDVYGETIFVLDNIDQCPDLVPLFWTHMSHIFETRDHPWKFILLTDTLEGLGDKWLMDWPCIDLKSENGSPLEIDPTLPSKLERTLLQLPETQEEIDFAIEKAAKDFLAGSAYCAGLVRFALRQLQHSKIMATAGVEKDVCSLDIPVVSKESFSSASIQAHVCPLNPSAVIQDSILFGIHSETNMEQTGQIVGTLMRRAMERVPVEKRQLVVDSLTWVIFAFRPPSTKELASALTVDESVAPESPTYARNIVPRATTAIVKELGETLPGVFEIGHEVRLSIPQLRDFFLAADSVWYDVKATAHRRIAQTCLKYLSTSTGRNSLSRLCTVQNGRLSTSMFKPQDDLAVYASEYWPRHFNLAVQSAELLDRVNKFFLDKPTVRAWEQALWFICDPMTRADRSYSSTLPLMASIGLRGVPFSYKDDEFVYVALVEATRHGQRETVRKILDSEKVEAQTAEAMLNAASTYGDEGFQIELVQRFSAIDALTLPRRLILRASWMGQYELVKLLTDLDVNLHPEEQDFLDQGPLHLATRHGHLEVAELIVNREPGLVSMPEDQHLPLSLAARFGHPKLVKLLLEHGADTTSWTPASNRPLSAACFDGKHAAARVLLEYGADPNLPDPKGRWPPLAIAARDNHFLCTKLLLQHNAEVNVETRGGTPLYQALCFNNKRICRLLLEHGADARYSGGEGTAVAVAAGKDNLELVKLLIEHGADLNSRADEEDFTALHRAIADSASVEMVKYLLETGADPNLRTPGEAPLYHAAFQLNADLVQLLMDHGAEVNISAGKIGWTPLHAAHKDATVTKILLDAGAAVDSTVEGSGHSALILAVMFNEPEVVDTLLAYKADINLRSRSSDEPLRADVTALHVAVSLGNVSIARTLLEAGADVNFQHRWNAVLHDAAMNSEEMLRTVMEFCPDLTVQDEFGNMALNGPVELACAKILVHGGSEVNHANHAGETPLSMAVTADRLDVARFLLKKGANVEISTPQGSVLHYACKFGSLDSVKMMLEANADANRTNPEAGSPLYAACERPMPWTPDQPPWEKRDRSARQIIECLLAHESKPNPNQTGGRLGLPLSAACAFCSAATVDVLLGAGADTDIYDSFGRYPIHFAARSSKENFQRLRMVDANLNCLDKSERNVLHYAVQSGHVDLVECILDATDGLINAADANGWTPILFAARGSHRLGLSRQVGWSAEVIRLLLDRGSDLWVISPGHEGDWSPLRLARYHGAPEEIQNLLMPGEETRAARGWKEEQHQSRRAAFSTAYCDCCLFDIHGGRYHCLECEDFDLCYVCIKLAGTLHPGHPFTEIGPEFEENSSKPSDHETSDEESDNSSDDEPVGNTELDESENDLGPDEEKDSAEPKAADEGTR